MRKVGSASVEPAAKLVLSRRQSLSSYQSYFSCLSFPSFARISKNTTGTEFLGAESEAANSRFCDWHLEFEKTLNYPKNSSSVEPGAKLMTPRDGHFPVTSRIFDDFENIIFSQTIEIVTYATLAQFWGAESEAANFDLRD